MYRDVIAFIMLEKGPVYCQAWMVVAFDPCGPERLVWGYHAITSASWLVGSKAGPLTQRINRVVFGYPAKSG